MDRTRFVAVDVLAQAVELAGAEPAGLGEQVSAEWSTPELRHAERMRAWGHGDLIAAGDDPRPTEQPQRIAHFGLQRTEFDDTADRGRKLVAGGDGAAGSHRFDGQFRHVVADVRPSDPLVEIEPGRAERTAMLQIEVDGAGVAGDQHRGTDAPDPGHVRGPQTARRPAP